MGAITMRDWKNKPELRDDEFDLYYWESPHKQITEDFEATVVKVHDGDTISLSTSFRDFVFPLRFLDINAPELSTGEQGERARRYLEDILLNEKVTVQINKKNRVEKWGRLLGWVIKGGMNINEQMVINGMAVPFDNSNEGEIPSSTTTIKEVKWRD